MFHIALELKGLKYEIVPVQLMKGEQVRLNICLFKIIILIRYFKIKLKPEFFKLNPMGQVPALIINKKTTITQSVK